MFFVRDFQATRGLPKKARLKAAGKQSRLCKKGRNAGLHFYKKIKNQHNNIIKGKGL